MKKRQLVFGFLFFVSILLVSSNGLAGSVTRDFGVSSIAPGQELDVDLIVDIDEGDPTETYYYIQEEVPAGWTINSAPGAIEIDGQNITWAESNPSDTVITYQAIPPASGNYQFIGIYAIGSPVEFGILGDEFIEVVQIITCEDGDGDGFDNCPISHPDGDPFVIDCDDTDEYQYPGQGWYFDGDSDSYREEGGVVRVQCSEPDPPVQWLPSEIALSLDPDCDDENPAVNPGEAEICDNGVDDDCNDLVDGDDPACGGSGTCEDVDEDTWDTCDPSNPFDTDGKPADCDDGDPIEYPGQAWYNDGDGDQYGQEGGVVQIGCERPVDTFASVELIEATSDCDDENPAVNPGEAEICDNGVDDDCNGYSDFYDSICADWDGGGIDCQIDFGFYCSVGKEDPEDVPYPAEDSDCNPPDTYCHYDVGGCGETGGVCVPDDNCFGMTSFDPFDSSCQYFEGDPGENYCCDSLECEGSAGGVCLPVGCPGGGHIPDGQGWCVSEYNGDFACCDCSLNCFDDDGDNYDICPAVGGCGDGLEADCDDTEPNANPGLEESTAEGNCNDGIDNDCDGSIDMVDAGCLPTGCIDSDGDGWNLTAGGECGPEADCDDENPAVNPGEAEICDNGVDDDCDGGVDVLDDECPGECVIDEDCDDNPLSSECTYWTCEDSVCLERGDDGYCDNGFWCDGEDFCHIDEGCQIRNVPDCDDGISCTVDDCDEGSDSCLNDPDNGLCDTGSGEICLPDFGGCGVPGECGNGTIEFGEYCDNNTAGFLLGGENCVSQDFPAGGDLGCYPPGHALECNFNYSGCSLLPKFDKFDDATTNFTDETEVPDIDEVINSILEINDSGMINYTGTNLNYTRLDLDEHVIIEQQKIGVDLRGNRMEYINVTANITFYDLELNNPRLFRDGVLCDGIVCNITNYTRGERLEAIVRGFSLYEVVACGDGICNGDESCSSCSADCGSCDSGNGDDDGDDDDNDDNGGTPPADTAECSDGIDNDGDGLIDYPNDTGCESRNDDDELPVDQLVGQADCEEEWVCTEWTECDENNTKTRNCYDENLCGTEEFKPQMEEYCETPGPVGGGLRLDIVFATVVTIVSMAGVIVGLTIWLRRRLDTGVVEKRKQLFSHGQES